MDHSAPTASAPPPTGPGPAPSRPAPQAATPLPDDAAIRTGRAPGRTGNRVFSGMSAGAGLLIMAVLALVTVFLISQALPAFTASADDLAEISFLRGRGFWGYVAPLVFGTLLSSLIALGVAVPLSIAVALFISHYAPRRLAQGLGYLVDLLAAIPSVVFGLWGFLWLVPQLDPLYSWLTRALGFIPLFADYTAPAKNIMTASLVLAVMILPIITATIREIFLQTPTLHEEASLALGATRYEMVRQAVLPFARSGIISASMLGLGRALGETMAVLMIMSPGLSTSLHLLEAGRHQTIAANIAAQFREAFGMSVNVLIATGLVLFLITFAVNSMARWVIARRAEFSGAN
ncbi:phosphate ABC transporter permease subunit PstC [Actinomyces capricornis]|nr:phosphate ABC transporter permease subunit PstC [Actinomyces capricornis]MDO5065091.1 phosphate ABC transporter permease subunit PstC [Actinomyces bowdenii]BDA64681.1 phosphate transport system permease protein [Actinomyces capricornis]